MRFRLGPAVIVLVVSTILVNGGPIRAQIQLPITPDPALCTMTPLTPGDMVAAASSPVAPARIEATPARFVLPSGSAADQATADAVIQTLIETIACYNAGQDLAFFAFYTDAYLTSLLFDEGITLESAQPLATPHPTDENIYGTLVSIREVILLPDGRVGVLADTIFPEETLEIQVDFFFMVQDDGQWKIDGIIMDLEAQFPPVATPAAA
jgi:hypothetical protein